MPDSNPGLMTIFTEALERIDPAERASYLDRVCGGNAELRQRVEELLAAHPGIGRFLEPERTSHHEPDGTAAHDPGAETGAHDPEGGTKSFAQGPSSPVRRFETPIGTTIGRYTLEEVIGEGGMGSVYLASQTDPVKRQVALKLIKSGMDSKAVLARFDAERQALALMDHPNIARVFDGGTTDRGQPFFVMELVRGLPITDYCDEKRLPVQARLELFVQVCQAVQHAHQKGIIHRDLKPGNVLVTEVDGRPTPKVIDFGVAKATEAKLTDMSYADTGAIVGTPAYMSPEQADPSCVDIDTRTDVYALGVILYELLTGSPPIDSKQFKRGAVLEMLRMVREVDPPKPSTKLSGQEALPNIAANRSIEPAKLAKALRGELDWVVMKALEKDRTRRYDTANGFARDIQRYLADEVVEARPPSAGYRLKKFVRRHKGQVLAASLVLFVLVGGIAGTTWGMLRAETRRGEAVHAQENEAERVKERDAALIKEQAALKAEADRADELRHRLGVSEMVLAAAAHFDSRERALAAERLERVPVRQRGWEWRYVKNLTHGGAFTLPGLRQGPYTAECTAVAFTPDGERVLFATRDSGMMQSSVRVWDARTGTLQHELKDIKGSVVRIAFSADGARMVTHEADQFSLDPSTSAIKVWDTKTWTLAFELKKPEAVFAIALSEDGKTLVAAGDRLKVWDLRTQKAVLELDTGKPDPDNRLLGGVALSPDGKRIAACGLRGNIRIWDAQKGGLASVAFNLPRVGGPVHVPELLPAPSGNIMISISFSPDGNRLLAGYSHGTAKVLDAATGAVLFDLKSRDRAKVQEIIREGMALPQIAAFSPDGSRIVLAGGDYGSEEAIVWDARTGKELHALSGHTNIVRCAAFSPDGTRLVTGSEDGTAKVWNARTGESRFEFGTDPVPLAAAFSPVDDRLVVAGKKTTIIDMRTGAVVHEQDGVTFPVKCVAYSRDGTRIVIAGGGHRLPGRAIVLDARTGAVLFRLEGLIAPVHDAAFSPDGAWIATTAVRTHDKPIEFKIWDARTSAQLHDLTSPHSSSSMRERGGTIAFSPDGSRFVTGCVTGALDAAVWDTKTLKPVLTLKTGTNVVHSVAWSADGTRILVAANDTATIRDAGTGEPIVELRGHPGEVMTCAFSPDGTRIVTGATDRTVRLWDARTGTTLLEWKGHTGTPARAAFNRDCTQIAAVIEKHGVIVWDAPEAADSPELRGQGIPVGSAIFSPDGSRIVAVDLNGGAKVWDIRTATVQFELTVPNGGIGSAAFTADGNRMVTQEWVRKGEMSEPQTRVRDARTGTVLPDEKIPETVPGQAISPDGRWFAHVAGPRIEFILLKPDEDELTRRRRQTMPDQVQIRRAFDQAIAAKDDFAARLNLKHFPENERPIREAQLAANGGRKPEAIGWYRKAAALYPRDAGVQLELGHLLRETGLKPEAVACYEKAIELDEALAGMGQGMSREDPEIGIACYRKAVQVHPGRADLQQALARLLHSSGKFEEAVAALRVRIGQEPMNAQLHSQLGDSLWDSGKRDEAFASYRTAVELDPGNEQLLRLAILQSWLGRDKELADLQKLALRHEKEAPSQFRSLTECFLSPAATPKEMEEPLAIVRERIKTSTRPYLWVRMGLGMGEYRTGNYAAAIDTLREASKAADTPTSGFKKLPAVADSYRAMALFRLGKKDEARALLAEVAAKLPPIPKDEILKSGMTQDAQQLLEWLSFKEAVSLIGLDATQPPGKK